jgi:hypothetical protein
VVRKLGNGKSTVFWTTNWIGEAPLSVAFPRLFSLSNQKESNVIDMFEFDGESRHWSFSWCMDLFQWEEDLVTQLRELLESVVLSSDEDYWSWFPDSEGVFSVKSSYKHLMEELRPNNEMRKEMVVVFDQILDSPVPFKVIAFLWQLLYDRIPTRCNLVILRFLKF